MLELNGYKAHRMWGSDGLQGRLEKAGECVAHQPPRLQS